MCVCVCVKKHLLHVFGACAHVRQLERGLCNLILIAIGHSISRNISCSVLVIWIFLVGLFICLVLLLGLPSL